MCLIYLLQMYECSFGVLVSPVPLLQLLLLQDTDTLMDFVQLQGTESPTVAATLYECVTVSGHEMAEISVLPCTPRPFWPYSSALQHHK